MSNKSGASEQIISLPKGGGALKGIGETFSPDLHTGTGNFTVPIALPPGRNGFQPQLNLVYSTGNGNGPFGLGWGLSIPGVSRKTSKGVPRYHDYDSKEEPDVFVLSGAEDLVPVDDPFPGITSYRPRTEGLFARIEHRHSGADDYWEVHSKDGLVSAYGTPGSAGKDPAVISDPAPANRDHLFAWRLTATEDPFRNRIEYEYQRDSGQDGPHTWDQLYLKEIRYVDYTDQGSKTQFLVRVRFEYQDRPDPFSDYRAGFEIRTRLRCKRIDVCTYPDGKKTPVRTYEFVYLDERDDLVDLGERLPHNRVSLLSQVVVIGYDDYGNQYDFRDPDPKIQEQSLPPLEFGHTRFDPEGRKFQAVTGADLPATSLASATLELADLTGDGLPDILEMNGTVRYWRNLGQGRFDLPRPMRYAPAGLNLADSGVQLVDADGDGRVDLLATVNGLSGYFPVRFDATWDRFQRFEMAPSFNLEHPEVKLVDLDGDGRTDVIRSGTRLECFFNDPQRGWTPERTRWVERQALEVFPNVNFSDPRVKWGDMSGDGLQDIVLVYDGNVEYWPNLGHGHWGKRIHMRNSPAFREYGYTFGYDPRRILVGDVDGDGLADIVYVGHNQVTLWINQSGNAWSDPIVIQGTPAVTEMDAVRLVDLLGTGVSGVLWSAEASSNGRPHIYFLDFTGGVKPYLMDEMDNHMGATTKVQYAPSTRFYLEDAKKPATRWKTPLPFPVQVVERVEVIDAISRGKLTTQYRYHHGYWDGAEREFRGFGLVEQTDTETFDEYRQDGLHGDLSFAPVAPHHFSPPTLTRTWFHQGPVGEEFGEWKELDRSPEYWQGDPELLDHTGGVNQFLAAVPQSPKSRRIKRDALRALRGSILRSELYALDGTERQDRPYTITEHAYDLVEISPPPAGKEERLHIFFPHAVLQRTTQWERGQDPMTQFSLTDYKDEAGNFDPFGRPHRQTAVAMPRRSAKRSPLTGAVVGTVAPDETRVLTTHTWTTYASPQAGAYIHDRVAQVRSYELANPPPVAETKPDDVATVLKDQLSAAVAIHGQFIQGTNAKLFGHVVNYYDGAAFTGKAAGDAGQYGALARSETLALTGPLLDAAYAGDPGKPSRRPGYLGGSLALPAGAPAGFGGSTGYNPTSADSTHEAGYYVDTKRVKFDFQDASLVPKRTRGVVLGMHDALGHKTQVTSDKYWFLPAGVKDAAGLETKADYNYRTLQPSVVTDPNENEAHFCYSPSGLVSKIWLLSNDRQEGGTEAKPELQYDYDFLNYRRTLAADPKKSQPIYVRTRARLYHANVSPSTIPHSDEVIESREYSDGFGRLVQKRTQAEDRVFGASGDEVGLLVKGKPVPGQVDSKKAQAKTVQDSVVVSGWQTYDNKGRVVEKYEPFFDQGWAFQPEKDAKYGQHATLFYDPRGQVIRTLNPDGSEQRVIFGVPGKIGAPDLKKLDDYESTPKLDNYEPTPWEGYTYDPNDLAEVSFHPDDGSPGSSPQPLTDVAQDATHYYTPVSTVLDGLGRVVCQVQRNGADPAKEWFVTRSAYDVRGNLLKVIDALGRDAFSHEYDLLNRPLRVDSIDAGLRTSVLDAQGNLIEVRDSKGSIALHQYDELNRPVGMWAIDGSGATQTLTRREKIVYGGKSGPANAEARHLLGKPYIYYDEAGKLTFERYDFKGNLVEKVRRVVSDAALAGGWTADWKEPVDESALEQQGYQTSTTFDALNRPITITYPQNVNGHRAVLAPAYNRAGALQSVKLDNDAYVDFIAYNAKGQRVLIAYGNGVMTRYAYDPHTFRLVRLRTETFTKPDASTWKSAPKPKPRAWLFQDLTYQYDLAGNTTAIQDRTPESGIRGTALGTDALDRAFTYDPIYRLLAATGREYATAAAHVYDDPFLQPAAGQQDPSQTVAYTQSFHYDPAGNMSQWHNGTTKTFALANNQNGAGSNRLDTVTVGKNPATQVVYHYKYDDNGNLIQENTERHFTWDHADRMIGFRNQPTPAGTPSLEARYLYDAGGMRVKKWVRRNGSAQTDESATYIDGIFEFHSWQEAAQGAAKQNNHLHVMDNQSRVAIRRVGDRHKGDKGPTGQYYLGDHLGSSNVVVGGKDAQANGFINREEFYPYGETSFGSYGKKRYRFTGKERDEESGLYYHGARYYAPWLARWMSSDPAILDSKHQYTRLQSDGSGYLYSKANPILFLDSDGKAPKSFYITLAHKRIESDSFLQRSKQYGEQFERESKGAFKHLHVRDLDDLVDQLNRELGPDDTIKTIMFASHGDPTSLLLPSTERTNTSDYQTSESLERAANRLGPLGLWTIQRKAAGATIVLHACNVGQLEEVPKAVGRFFGAKGGTIYSFKVYINFYQYEEDKRIELFLDENMIAGGEVKLDSKQGKSWTRVTQLTNEDTPLGSKIEIIGPGQRRTTGTQGQTGTTRPAYGSVPLGKKSESPAASFPGMDTCLGCPKPDAGRYRFE